MEVLTLQRLRSRVAHDLLATPRRPTFHHLLTVNRGTLRHTVDFTAYALAPGTWLWVRPGQVQQWSRLDDVDGTLVLFQPAFLDPDTGTAARLDDPHAPVLLESGGDEQRRLADAAGHLARVCADPGSLPLEVHQAVLRHLLAVLVLRLAHLGAAPGSLAPDPNDTFLRLRDAVERDFTRTRRLEDYARTLGYSARTLSRAAQTAAGVNAKEFIDRRVILEARRLLAHSDHTAAQIAARLGFTSATNFSKYFHQRTGTTPIAFRAAVRGGASPGPS
ncbi:helix-turn-helix domain-containing protein [Catenuloplanes indicus]|uniref:AraC-like DNA-binding protein n=1 Tax=Catenuloplanes indicus TaxID=137267 RepID=A0AAE3VTV4_9ACTN|nr:helix-turn-helix transcriptional regulator [Catenuloplanes indicus]MDQ0363611.1 AraC-like DNA-binding protein [Catenuloplanes indicus]